MYGTYSIVVSTTFVLAFVSNELLPKRIVFIKTDSERSRKLVLIFYDGAQESTSLKKNTWNNEEDSTQLIQYQNHNYRTCLKNLENYI